MPNRGQWRSWRKNRLLDDLFFPCRVFAISMGTVVCHPSTTKCCSNIFWVLFPLFFASSVGLWLSFCVRSQVFYTQPAPWDATDITRPLFSRVLNITICNITQLRQHSSLDDRHITALNAQGRKPRDYRTNAFFCSSSTPRWPLFQGLKLELEK